MRMWLSGIVAFWGRCSGLSFMFMVAKTKGGVKILDRVKYLVGFLEAFSGLMELVGKRPSHRSPTCESVEPSPFQKSF